MISTRRRTILAAIKAKAVRLIVQQHPAESVQAKRAQRRTREVRADIAKAPDLKRVERKIDLLLERRSFGEPQET